MGVQSCKNRKKRDFYGIFYHLNGVKSRQNCDIDLYFGNILLQLLINIDFCQEAVVSLSAPKNSFWSSIAP